DGQDEWPARIAAGIREAVDFCVANPDAAQALVIDTRTVAGAGDYLEMVDGFAELVDCEAGSDRRSAGSPTDEARVGALPAIGAHHIRSERRDRLEEAVPELVYLALLPYLGFEQAKGWADISARA